MCGAPGYTENHNHQLLTGGPHVCLAASLLLAPNFPLASTLSTALWLSLRTHVTGAWAGDVRIGRRYSAADVTGASRWADELSGEHMAVRWTFVG